MGLGRRSQVSVGLAAAIALAGLMSASGVAIAGDHLSRTQLLEGVRPVAGPPLGRAKPAASAPNLASTGASPWTLLKNPPPFGTPGTMLLESDGTVLVHDEPDNNSTGGTNAWYKLTPNSKGSYVDGTWSRIASMPAANTSARTRCGRTKAPSTTRSRTRGGQSPRQGVGPTLETHRATCSPMAPTCCPRRAKTACHPVPS
jgi:hypothetical protein